MLTLFKTYLKMNKVSCKALNQLVCGQIYSKSEIIFVYNKISIIFFLTTICLLKFLSYLDKFYKNGVINNIVLQILKTKTK